MNWNRAQGKDDSHPQQNLNEGFDFRQLFHLVSKNSYELITILDCSGIVQFVNDRTAALFRGTVEEFTGKHYNQVLVDDNQNQFIRDFDQLLSRKEKYVTQFSAKLQGQRRWLEVTTQPFLGQDGAVIGLLILSIDITEQNLALKALTGAQAFHHALFHHAEEAIFVIDDQANFQDVNPAACELLGYEREEFFSDPELNASILLRNPLKQTIINLLNTEGSARGEVQVQTRAGETINFVFYAIGNILPGQHLIVGRDVTSQRKIEQELIESEERYRSLFETVQEAIIIFDNELHLIDGNPFLYQLIGYTKEEIAGQDVQNIVPDIGTPEWQKRVAEFQEKGVLKGEVRMINRSGKTLDTEFVAIKDFLPGLNLAMIHDITARKQAEIALKNSESRYRTLTNLAPVGIFQADAQGNNIYVNDQVCRFTGLPPGDHFGIKWAETIHPDDREHVFDEWMAAIAGKSNFESEFRFINKEGKVTWVASRSAPLLDATKRITGHIGTLTDITDHKEIIEVLHENRANLSALIENTDGSIWSVDENYCMIVGNSTFENNVALVRGKPFQTGENVLASDFPGDMNDTWRELYGRALQGEQFSVEITRQFDQKASINEFRLSPILSDQGKVTGVTVFGRDITKRKQAESVLRESEEKFRQIAERVKEVFWLGAPDWSEIHYINTQYEEVWGRTCESLYQRPLSWMEAIHEEDRQKVQDAIKEKVRNNLAVPEFPEYRIIRPDGEIRWILARAYPVSDDQGDITRVAGIAEDITARKLSEQALRDSELRYRALFNSASDAIFIIQDNIFISCNEATVKVFGYGDISEIINRSPWDLSPVRQPDGRLSREKAIDLIEKAKDGGSQKFIWKHLKADGTPFDAEVSLNTILINGRTYLQAILRDITERKLAEEALRESEARYSSLVNVSPNAILIVQQGKYVFANPAGAKMLGYDDPRNVIGLSTTETTTPRFREAVIAQEERTLTGQKNDFSIIEVRQPSGEIRQMESFSIPYKYRDRPASLMIGIDVTEKLTQENMLSNFYKVAPLGVGIVVDRMFVEANDMLYQMTGYTREEFINRDLRFLYFSEEDYLMVGETKNQQIQDAGVGVIEANFKRKDGSKIDVLISSIPIDRNDLSKGISTTVLDISDRKQAERMLQNLNEELEERVRLRTEQLEKKTVELESFSYSISHDLRAPLRAINGLSQILLDEYSQEWPGNSQSLLENIITASRKMDNLIDGLLMLSRLGQKSMMLTQTDITRLASQVFHSLTFQRDDRQIDFIVQEIPQVWADQQLLETALTNLISNAIKFTRRREKAVIELGVTGEPDAPVFYVRDNGIGFNPKYADKLFTPFQRLESEEDFEGTGVGLTIVKRIIERHQGSIWVEAEEDKGATFYFTLRADPADILSEEFLE